MLGIQVCATHQGQFSLPKMKNRPRNWNFFLEQALIFKELLKNRIIFLTIWSQTSKMQLLSFPIPIFFSKNISVFLAKHPECVPVTITVYKLYSNKLMLPVGTLVSCNLMITYSRKKNSINKRVECFHFCSFILNQRVPGFL